MMLSNIINRLRNGYVVYHFGVSCTRKYLARFRITCLNERLRPPPSVGRGEGDSNQLTPEM